MDFPFLSEVVKHGSFFKPKERYSTPFPQSEDVPEFLYSTILILEWVDRSLYLRCTENPLFCKNVEVYENSFVYQELDEVAGEMVDVEVNYKLLVAIFGNESRTVGYVFDGKPNYFLPYYQTKKKHNELDERLQWLYYSARLASPNGLIELSKKSQDVLREMQGIDSELSPIDEFAERLFYDKYGGNIKLLSDSEYARVFGVHR